MTLEEGMATAGLGLAVVAFVLLARAVRKTAEQRAAHYRQLPEEYPGMTGDVYALLIWSGMLLLQISNILNHAEPGGFYRVVPLMWVGTAAVVFSCGLHAGRLMMRLEMRAHKAKRDEQAREART